MAPKQQQQQQQQQERDDGCTPCPYSAGSTYQDLPNDTDPQCFQKTEQAFLGSLFAGDEGEEDSSAAAAAATTTTMTTTTTTVCQHLRDDDPGGQLFWALYYLDMTYCGLAYVDGQWNLDRKFELF